MSAWTTPITWTNGAVSASQANTELRDHLNWLKAALDLLTAASISDVGTTTYLRIVRAAAGDRAFQTRLAADSQPRLEVRADGSLWWGSGAATPETSLTRVTDIKDSASAGAGANVIGLELDRPLRIALPAITGYDTGLWVGTAADSRGRIGLMGPNGGFGRVIFADGTTRRVSFGDGFYGEQNHIGFGVIEGNPLRVTVEAGMIGDYHALNVKRPGDPYAKVALGQDSAGRARIAFGDSSAPMDAYLTRLSTGVIMTQGVVYSIPPPVTVPGSMFMLFGQDNGGGKAQAIIKWPGGGFTTLATEP